ncbi:uncharacterized protein LOC124686759 [Lolium rigidum]|uniref:uncharacterized protein LOC124686759 n=1 Tax=Lolium rigidum TaxID=89674 RepID=UPI001F5C3970|nr:uncharacterized protein LOC124686759 [Lolium rigidum]
MASVVFETIHDAVAVGGDDVVFCVVILCLSVLSLVIFAASSAPAGGDEEEKRRRRSGSRANGPVFVGGWGCACGGCRAGAGVCGTYLS